GVHRMPCNLAVSITKATTAPEHLQKLLTSEVVKAVVESFVKTHEIFKGYQYQNVRLYERMGMVEIYLGFGHRLELRQVNGVWTASGRFPRGEEAKLENMTSLLSVLLSKGADRLYARQVKAALQQFGQVNESQAKVNDGEEMMNVTLLQFEV
ncbi:MAG: hypothetical protein ACRDHZ_00380, partial [Ktedonobacteraceae bacterium]